MNMTADVMIQQNVQSETSGVIQREWLYDRTIRCKIEPIKTSGATIRSKSFYVQERVPHAIALLSRIRADGSSASWGDADARRIGAQRQSATTSR